MNFPKGSTAKFHSIVGEKKSSALLLISRGKLGAQTPVYCSLKQLNAGWPEVKEGDTFKLDEDYTGVPIVNEDGEPVTASNGTQLLRLQ